MQNNVTTIVLANKKYENKCEFPSQSNSETMSRKYEVKMSSMEATSISPFLGVHKLF
jgi:hypothetical protein